MLNERGFKYTITCDYCGKIFWRFDLSRLYYRGEGKDFEEYVWAAICAGHIVDGSKFDGYGSDDSLDFCNRRCMNKYHSRYFPDKPSLNVFDAEYDIEELVDNSDEIKDFCSNYASTRGCFL